MCTFRSVKKPGMAFGVHRVIIFILSVFTCFTCTGVVFGWPPLQTALRQTHQYEELCPHNVTECSEQDAQFNIIYTIGASSNTGISLFFGIIFDRFGPKPTVLIGHLLFIAGSLLMAFSHSIWFDAYMWAFMLLGLGGRIVFIGHFHVGQLFPKQRAVCLSVISAMFTASSLVFYIFQKLYEYAGVTLKIQFLVLGGIHLFLLLFWAVVMPWSLFTAADVEPKQQKAGPLRDVDESDAPQYSETSPLTPETEQPLPSSNYETDFEQEDDEDQNSKPKKRPRKPKPSSAPAPKGDSQPFWRQLRDPVFIATFIYCVFMIFVSNYFIGSLNTKLDILGDHDLDHYYTGIFGLMFPFGMVFAPVYGVAMERIGFAICFVFVSLMTAANFAIICIPNLPLQIAGFVLFTLARPLFFATFPAFLVYRFGFTHFGKLSGLIFTVLAAVQFLQIPLLSLVHIVLEGDFLVVDASIAGLVGLSLVFPLYLAILSYCTRRRQLVDKSQYK